MPKINQSVETSVFDEHGNMMSKRANKTLSWGPEPNFVKLYLGDIIYFKDMPKGYSAVLYEFLKRMTYAGEEEPQVIYINAAMKRIIAKTLDKSVSAVNNCLTDLVKGELFKRVEVGVYQVNPYLFGKGDWQDISRLRLEINYDAIKGRTFKAVCKYNEDKDGQLEMLFMTTGTDD